MSLSRLASTDANATPVGTSGPDTLRGTNSSESIHGKGGDDYLYGNGGNDRLYGDGGNDVIHGGLGRDTSEGGAGADTFVFNNITESYQGGGHSHSDLILDFSSHDRIDVSALGFTGLGNGHDHTLRVEVNDAGTRTYLKSYAVDEGGDRFQLAFEGDVSQYLTQERVIGNGGDDVINSGLGANALRGGAGADTFVFDNILDSYQQEGISASDLILDFSEDDRIDVSALGFTGLGDGQDHSLRVEVNDAGTRTYLKSYESDESGRRFQVAFDGDVSQYLVENNLIFASTNPTTSGSQATVSSTAHEAVAVEPLGVPPHDPSGTA
ncbi:hypothetical protein [Pseudomonas typographi]|uniref:hypothetical protein n=1 Tax=Pseudomonas typographi TaxID=2715964 RepID=UPI00168505B0|nr:hypothetical protein [Pseudomonas typographi]MBD1586877.1 hypothetical protein [Pseudomonas typographi]